MAIFMSVHYAISEELKQTNLRTYRQNSSLFCRTRVLKFLRCSPFYGASKAPCSSFICKDNFFGDQFFQSYQFPHLISKTMQRPFLKDQFLEFNFNFQRSFVTVASHPSRELYTPSQETIPQFKNLCIEGQENQRLNSCVAWLTIFSHGV